MNTEKINLDIEGKEFECEVEFDYTAGRPAVLFALPENCSPEEPEEWEITGLTILIEYPHITDKHDIGFIIEDLAEVIVEKLQELSE